MDRNCRTIIVVPLYRNFLSPSEAISIHRCYEVWSEKYEICVVSPEGVDMHEILKHYPKIKQRTVPTGWMASIAEYNKMLIGREFYSMFESYDYMLIYQSDCFVFEDRLQEWVDKGYDYVGAPWYFNIGEYQKFIGKILYALKIYHTDFFRWGRVGNGGLSLRKIKTFLQHLDHKKRFSSRAQKGRLNEDIYWSMVARELTKPTAAEAADFCGDMTPTICPQNVMAAHGWNKNNDTLHYWHSRMEKCGYSGTQFVE